MLTVNLPILILSLPLLIRAKDPIDSVLAGGAEVLTSSRLSGQTIRQCSCREQRICVDEMKQQAKDCTVPCFARFSTITDRPMELKQCFDSKNIVLESFLTCFEDRVDGCVTSENGGPIPKTDIRALFKYGERKIVSQTAALQSIIAPIRHILDAAGEFAKCVKDCFLDKNNGGFCFDRFNCQPYIAEDKARLSFRTCTRKLHWKQEAGSLCDCSVHAGVNDLQQYCSMFRLMARKSHHHRTG